MTTSKIRHQFKVDGAWAKLDAATIQAFFRDHVQGFVEPVIPMANVVRGEALKEEIQFSSTDDWVSALVPDLYSVTFSSYGSQRSVWFNWTLPGRLTFTATGDEVNMDAARSLVETAQEVFRLAQREQVTTPAPRSSMSGMYRCPRMPDTAWLDEATALIKGFGNGACTAWYRLGSSPQITRTTVVSELRERMSAREQLADWSISCGGCRISYMANGNVSVNATSESDDAVLAFIAESQKRLDLVPVADTSNEEVKTVTRLAFLKEHPTVEWFAKLAPALAQVTGEHGQMNGGRLRTVINEDMTFRTIERWRSELEARWKELAVAGLSWAGPAGSVNVSVDLRRELATVIFNLNRSVNVNAAAERLEVTSGLDPAPQDVYKYRKYGRTYHIDEWLSTSNRNYADAIEQGVKLAFEDRPVAVTRAFVEAGEPTASLESFQTVKDFADWFRRDLPFQTATLTLEGFRGWHLGIHADRSQKTFRILGNLDLDLFKGVDDGFKNVFVRSGKKDTGVETSMRSNDALKFYLPLGVTFFGILIAAAWNPLSAWREQPALEIVYPQDKAEFKGTSVHVQWTYRDPRVFGRANLDPKYPAEVQLRVDGKDAQPVVNGLGNADITHLQPGAYTIIVSTPGAMPVSRNITVSAPPGK